MKNLTIRFSDRFSVLLMVLLFLVAGSTGFAQQIKWLRITELQGPYGILGGEYEGQFSTPNGDFFSWPADYGIEQNTIRSRALWIGCTNFDDTLFGVHRDYKVIGVGPRDASDRINQVFPVSIKLSGRRAHPIVTVDNMPATPNNIYDKLDEVNPNLEADRIITIKFNTSVGISVVKKILAFDNPYHSQYHINDYTFKNTGIYNTNRDVKSQTLHGVYFFFNFRYTFLGESANIGEPWWGYVTPRTTAHHNIGDNKTATEFTDPSSPLYHMRAFYCRYMPNAQRLMVTYAEDWGLPNISDGVMAAAKFGGIVTLHADVSTNDKSDDLNQPATTWYTDGDRGEFQLVNADQFNDAGMALRYALMSEGHPAIQHDSYWGGDSLIIIPIPEPAPDEKYNKSQNIAYGPYEIAPGDSIHIVFAEGINGISREKNREVGGNWIQYYNSTGAPTLVLPDSSTTTDHNLYKRRWFETCKDSILQTYRRAMANYAANYVIPKPPPPPSFFKVISGGDRIALEWDRSAPESDLNFGGYVIYRSEGNVLGAKTRYTKIFECDAAGAVGNYNDLTPVRGLNYYYYIQSKDRGNQGTGQTLYSSMFWTVSTLPATLQRPAGDYLGELRVVPNPYDIRARQFQFGNGKLDDHDQIAFYGLPPKCEIKVFTERGDLVWQKNHTKPTGDELWYSETMSSQILVSGIYIVYVKVTEDIYALSDITARADIYGDDLKVPLARTGDVIFHQGDLMFHKGDSKFRKFVIIR